MKKLVILSVISCASLAGCATTGSMSNTQSFNGERYKIAVAELGANRAPSTVYFQNTNNPLQNIIIERSSLTAISHNAMSFTKDWLAKEQVFRTNDCQLSYKTYQDINYATCQIPRKNSSIIYVINSIGDNGYARVLIDNTGKQLSLNDEQNAVKALASFYSF